MEKWVTQFPEDEYYVSREVALQTHGADGFFAILAVTGATGPSVLQVRTQDVLPVAIGRNVVRVLTMRARAVEAGAIVTIDELKSPVRGLPMGRSSDDSEPPLTHA